MLIRLVLALFAIIALMWAGLRIAEKTDNSRGFSRAAVIVHSATPLSS
jgi:hypothetical protein